MLQTTIDLLRAGLRTDPTVTPGERTHLLALLRQGLEQEPPPQPKSIRSPAAADNRPDCNVRSTSSPQNP